MLMAAPPCCQPRVPSPAAGRHAAHPPSSPPALQGMTPTGIERKATCQALFAKMLYLTECEALIAQESEAFKAADLRQVGVRGSCRQLPASCSPAAGRVTGLHACGVIVWGRAGCGGRGVRLTSLAGRLRTAPPLHLHRSNLRLRPWRPLRPAPALPQVFGATEEDLVKLRISSLVDVDVERLERLMGNRGPAPGGPPGGGGVMPAGHMDSCCGRVG